VPHASGTRRSGRPGGVSAPPGGSWRVQRETACASLRVVAEASGGGARRPVRRDRDGGASRNRTRPVEVLLALLVLLFGGLPGCTRGDAARTAAAQFIDAYYIEANLPKARDEAVGLARSKIEDQIKLVSGQSPADPGQRPTIHYELLQAQDQAERDRRGFLFELSIHLDGGEKLARRTLVTMREEGGTWRVANFQELD